MFPNKYALRGMPVCPINTGFALVFYASFFIWLFINLKSVNILVA